MTTARARRTDPPSSHEAAARVEASGIGARQAEYVLWLVRAYPGCTSGELSFNDISIDRYQISRRLPELERAGLIWRSGPRVCRALGSRQMTWWPVQAQGRML